MGLATTCCISTCSLQKDIQPLDMAPSPEHDPQGLMPRALVSAGFHLHTVSGSLCAQNWLSRPTKLCWKPRAFSWWHAGAGSRTFCAARHSYSRGSTTGPLQVPAKHCGTCRGPGWWLALKKHTVTRQTRSCSSQSKPGDIEARNNHVYDPVVSQLTFVSEITCS